MLRLPWLADEDELLAPDPETPGEKPPSRWARFRPGQRIGPRTLAVFSRQLAVLLDAGMPLLQGLDILGATGQHPGLREALLEVRSEVHQGSSLARAMERRPQAFDDLYVNLVAAGEASGALDRVMERLATHIEKIARLRGQVRSALAYPAAILSVAGAVVFLILWKVIPVFQHLFADMGGDLPLLTRVVVGVSEFIGASVLFLAGGAAATGAAAARLLRTPRGRRMADMVLIQMPLLGRLLRRIIVGRCCRTLSVLMASGVPVVQALDDTAGAAGNVVFTEELRKAARDVRQGSTIHASLRQMNLFPAMLCQIVHVGEQTGTLAPMLDRMADFYEEEVDRDVESIMKLLEPALISILGVVIGTIVISMYLPMYSALTRIS